MPRVIQYVKDWEANIVPESDPLLARRFDMSDNDLLKAAASNGHAEVVRLILRGYDDDPGLVGDALVEASSNGHLGVAKELIGSKLLTLPHLVKAAGCAASNGHSKIVHALIEYWGENRLGSGQNPGIRDDRLSPLYNAVGLIKN